MESTKITNKKIMKDIQIFVAEPNELGMYCIAKFNTRFYVYEVIPNERFYSLEEAKERARILNNENNQG